jgi:glycosyltransferase involved in cell wall biosynthesis
MEAGAILFIGKRFYTNKDALQERFGRIFHLPSEWSRSGRTVLLWLVDYHSRTAEDSRAQAMRIVSTPVRGVAILKVFVEMIRTFRPKVVVASGDCYIGFMAWLLSRMSGAVFVFDIYDKYDEFAGYRKPLGFDLFGFLIRRASLSLYASRGLAESLVGAMPSQAWHVVPNGVDAKTFLPLDQASCRKALDLDQRWVLAGYFGGMEPDRGVSDIIEAVAMLRNRGEDIRLLICGKEHPQISLHQDWIIYRGMVPHDRMPLYLNASDVLVVPYRLSEFMDMGASCKIAEYLMCGKPLVSTTTPNLLANFPAQATELGDGVCRPADPQDMARAIASQLRHPAIASTPPKLTWAEIASDALGAINDTTGKVSSDR